MVFLKKKLSIWVESSFVRCFLSWIDNYRNVHRFRHRNNNNILENNRKLFSYNIESVLNKAVHSDSNCYLSYPLLD